MTHKIRQNRGRKPAMLIILMLLPFVVLEIALRGMGIGEGVVYEANAVYGYRPEPGQSFSTLGHPVTILENGFRGPVANSDTLYVGDSVTYGCAFIRDEDTFVARLGGLNAGVNGWGPVNVARFLDQADLTGLKQVVWIIPTADVLRPYMTLRKGLISTNRKMWFRLEYLWRFVMYGLLIKQDDYRDPSALQSNIEAIQSTFEYLSEKGVQLTIVFFPYQAEWQGETVMETPYLTEMLSQLDAAEVPYIQIMKPDDTLLSSSYRDGVHLTTEGHAWFAEELEEKIQQGDPAP